MKLKQKSFQIIVWNVALKDRGINQISVNKFQSLTFKVSQIRDAYSTASPISCPCLPSSKSTSSSSYSPLICGTLIVMRMSVDSFSSRRSVRMMAVKSGAPDLDLSTGGVCVAMSV